MKLLSLTLFLSLILATRMSAQQASSSVWMDAIKRRPQEVLLVLTEDASHSWPAIHSKDVVATMPKEQQAEFNARLELAQQLIAALKSTFTEPAKSFESLKTEARLATAAARKVGAENGYVNLLLRDIIYRGTLLQLSGWLVQHPSEQQAILTVTDSLQMPDIDLRALLRQLQREDAKLAAIHLALDKPLAAGSLPQQLMGAGIPEETVMSLLTEFGANTASDHLNNPDLIRLIARLAATLAQANHLREACEYLQRGGKLDMSELADFAKYKKLMADRIYKRQANGLAKKPDYGEGIISLIELHRPASELGSQYIKVTFD